MKLKKSPKIYNSYKSAFPKNTIKKIEKGFNKLGISLIYRNINYASNKKIGMFFGKIDARYNELILLSQFGKGTSEMLSKSSAYAELAERFSANLYESTQYKNMPIKKKYIEEFWDYRNLKSYTNKKIRNIHNYVSPKELLVNSNLKDSELNEILNSDVCSHWVDGYSIIKKKKIKVPIVLISKIQASNGFGAGNTNEEALTHAIFESIERYALQEVITKKIKCPTIKKNSIKSSIIKKYMKKFKKPFVDIQIKDLSLEKNLPVVGILFINKRKEKDPLINKMGKYKFVVGCDFNLENALIRCFTESSTGEPFFNPNLSWITKKVYGNDYWENYFKKLKICPKESHSSLINSIHCLTYQKEDIYFLDDNSTSVEWENIKKNKNKDFLDDINQLILLFKKNSWDCIVINHTHPIINFPVLRVVIPGISDVVRLMNSSSLKESIINRNPFFISLYNINKFPLYLDYKKKILNKKELVELIKNIEDFLKKYENSYKNEFHLYGENFDLLSIVAFGSLVIENLKKSIIYFEVLKNREWRNMGEKKSYEKIIKHLSLCLKNKNFSKKKFLDLIKKINISNIYFKELKYMNPFSHENCKKCKKRSIQLKKVISSFD